MLFGLEALAAGLLYVSVADIQCRRQPVPPVRVVPVKSAIQYDNNKDQAQLETMEIDTVNPYGAGKKTHVGGLMSGEIAVEHRVGFVQERYARLNQTCLHYDSVDVSIVINPTIYIAKEHKPDSCRYKTILDHEHKHVEVDRLIVNKYARRIGEALTFALNKYGATFGPFPQEDIPAAQTRLKDYIDGIVKTEVDAMNEERMSAQQAVDTIEEYERVRKLCP